MKAIQTTTVNQRCVHSSFSNTPFFCLLLAPRKHVLLTIYFLIENMEYDPRLITRLEEDIKPVVGSQENYYLKYYY